MSGEVERAYPYKGKWGMMLSALIFLGCFAGFFVYMGLTNNQALLINGILEMPPLVTTVFYWGVGVLFLGLAVLAGILFAQAIFTRQRIALTPAALLVPKSFWSSKEMAIPYRDVIELRFVADLYGNRALHVTHPGGKFLLDSTLLPTPGTFDEVHALLVERVRAAQLTTVLP